MIDRDVLRLELVKLTYKVGLQNADEFAVAQAKALEEYVQPQEEPLKTLASAPNGAEPEQVVQSETIELPVKAQKSVPTPKSSKGKGKADTSNPFD